jgi:hypothetical protein
MLDHEPLALHLAQHGVVIQRLRQELAETLPGRRASDKVPQPDITFQKVVNGAVVATHSRNTGETSTFDVFKSLINEGIDSTAVKLLVASGSPDSLSRLRKHAV